MIRRKLQARGGINTRFPKGIIPWNKGLHFVAGGRSAETRFKPGQIRGSAARKYKPVGSITIRKDPLPMRLRHRKRKKGMPPWPRNLRRYIKIKDTGPPQYCWIPYAKYLWEKTFGPVPAGCFIVHIDGNTLNDSLGNLHCVDRAGHLALQLARDPDMRRKMISSSMRTRRKNRKARMLHRKAVASPSCGFRWECSNCFADYNYDPIRCIKCGRYSIVKVSIRGRQAGRAI